MLRTSALVVVLATAAFGRLAYQFAADSETILSQPLQSTFDCVGREYGYYADVDNNCEVFHVCLPVTDDLGEVLETAQFSFICGNQTVFSQDSLTCSLRELASPCQDSQNLYGAVAFGDVTDTGVQQEVDAPLIANADVRAQVPDAQTN
ncbi:unnamed protein product [Meganyctiphanes norvegica]|uniref:Chitin-binding type-2 domain-containing protein n=1 Tax=Meganyctiphanes norvegica TaxID=48144 RepID=A0AAV2Q7F1_MEGNR